MRWRGPVALVALWLTAACLATLVGLVAVRLVAGDLGDPVASPLSDAKVQDALDGVAPPPAAVTTRSPRPRVTTPAAPTRGALRTIRSRAGVVSARCEGGRPTLVYATPADGWRTERSTDSLVRFGRSDEAVTVRLACSGTTLLSTTTTTSTEDEHEDRSPSPSPSPSRSRSPSPEPSDSPDPHESEQSGSDDH